MPIIKPISDLRNHADEISDLCHQENEPVFITKNGQGDLVVMSHAHYERLHSLLELYKKLDEAEVLAVTKKRGITHSEMMKLVKEHLE